MMKATPARAALAVLLFALAGCELRQDQAEETPPAATPSAPASETPAPEESAAPVASIIREDALPGPIVEVPPEPLIRTVPFGEGGGDLSTRAERILAGILESEAIKEDWPIVLRGHTDSAGNDRSNLRASRARAEAVAAWLVDRGVDDERIEVIAMGEQNPVAPNALPDGSPDEQGRARNRRVEVEIAPPRTASATPAGRGAEGEASGKRADKPA